MLINVSVLSIYTILRTNSKTVGKTMSAVRVCELTIQIYSIVQHVEQL